MGLKEINQIFHNISILHQEILIPWVKWSLMPVILHEFEPLSLKRNILKSINGISYNEGSLHSLPFVFLRLSILVPTLNVIIPPLHLSSSKKFLLYWIFVSIHIIPILWVRLREILHFKYFFSLCIIGEFE